VDEKTASTKVSHGFRNRKGVKPQSVTTTPTEKRMESPSSRVLNFVPHHGDPAVDEYMAAKKRFKIDTDSTGT
jgi:hypothetical protein